MADILIRNMEMPQDGRITIQIGADGTVYLVEKCTIMAEKYKKSSHAIPLPAGHGRLGDLDVMVEGLMKCAKNPPDDDQESVLFYLFAAEIAKSCQTIVPAEGGSE